MAAVSHVVFALGVMADHPRSDFHGLNSVLKSLVRRIKLNSSGYKLLQCIDFGIGFYLLLANSITVFNIRQYRRFPSIFRVEYEVGNWPSTGSMSLVRIQKSGSFYRVRPSTI